jgi:FkbM family methyltransferase
VRAVGLIAAIVERWQHVSTSIYEIRPKSVAHPLAIRSGSSDIEVFHQIFVEEEYACLDNISDVGLIIDAGAYVGYSSIYFLNRFPHCHIVAIEPDPDNFAVLQRNLSKYGERIELVNAGIWSHTTQLVLQRAAYRDGYEYTKQVRECENGEVPEMDGVDIESILSASRYDRVSLLKMDIEGAEAVVFAGTHHEWLSRIDAIAIELHDDSSFGIASDAFFSAIKGQDFQVSRSGELTICLRTGITKR